MLNKLNKLFLRKINGADFTHRNIDALKRHIDDRLDNVDENIRGIIQSLTYQYEWNNYLGFGVPLYLLQNGKLALTQQLLDNAEKAIIISIPKSGTYLLSAILGKLGLINAGIHVWETGFSDYRGKTIPDMVHRYSEFTVNEPLELTAGLIMSGQYVVGHIGYEAETRKTLASFKRILAVREMRQCLVSNMRWFDQAGRGLGHESDWKEITDPKRKMYRFLTIYGNELLALARQVSEWQADSEILRVRFEDLLGDNGSVTQANLVTQIASHLNRPLPESDVQALIESVLNQPTKTWSGKRSCLNDYWDQECEAIFLAKGGNELNILLGYTS